MPPLAIKTEALGRIYRICGIKKERAICKELIALADVNLSVEQGELFGAVSILVFRARDCLARERSLIDRTTIY